MIFSNSLTVYIVRSLHSWTPSFYCRKKLRINEPFLRNRILLDKWRVHHLVRKFPVFYGTRIFITVFREDATPSYTKPNEFSPSPSIVYLQDPIRVQSGPRLDLPSSFFAWSFPTESLCLFFFSPQYVPHGPPFTFFSMLLRQKYLLKFTNYEASRYAVFSVFYFFFNLGPNTFLNTLFSKTSVYALPIICDTRLTRAYSDRQFYASKYYNVHVLGSNLED